MCVELESEELLGVSGDCPRHILPHSARRVLPQAKWLGLPIWLEMIWRATMGGSWAVLGQNAEEDFASPLESAQFALSPDFTARIVVKFD